MKSVKKLLSILLSVMFVLSMAAINPAVVKAAEHESYTYKVRIVLGGTGDEGAEFVKNLGIITPKHEDGEKQVEVKLVDDKTCIVISNLKYNDKLTIDPNQLVKIEPKEREDEDGNKVQYQKYCVKGLRFAGQNDVYSAATFNVTYDETFVVAYGVGEIVPYIVNYVQKDGSPLPDPEHEGEYIKSITGYALANEELYVSFRNVDGYKPNTYQYHTKALKAPTVDDEGVEHPFEFTFYYSPKSWSSTVDETVEVTQTSTVQGDPEYTYQTVNRGTRVEGGGGNAGGGNAAAGVDEGNAGGDAAGDAGQTVVDNDEPADVIDIDDEDVARAGGEPQDKLVRNMIVAIIIAIIAVLAILIALIVADRKRKAQIANTNRKDDNE